MLVALELDMAKLKKELKQKAGEGARRDETRQIFVDTDVADMLVDLSTENKDRWPSVANYVREFFYTQIKAHHDVYGKKAEKARKIKDELRALAMARKKAPPQS